MSEAVAIIPLCRHIRTNGHRCQSPALHGADLCFFHGKLHNAHRRPPVVEALSSGWQESAVEAEGDPEGDPFALARVYPRQDDIQFPPLEDPESIQLATSMLFQAIATGQIYFKRARLLLYTLKIACINQRALANARSAESSTATVPTHITRTADGLALAPPNPAPPTTPPADSLERTAYSSGRPTPPPSVPTEPSSTQPTAPPLAGRTQPVAPAPTAHPIPAWAEAPCAPTPSPQSAASATHTTTRPEDSATPPADSLKLTAYSSRNVTPPTPADSSPTTTPAQTQTLRTPARAKLPYPPPPTTPTESIFCP